MWWIDCILSFLIFQAHKRSAERLLSLANSNKGVFIKVGQHLGALDYLLPQEYIETLRVLHSNAPESSLSDVFRVIKEDLQCDVSFNYCDLISLISRS